MTTKPVVADSASIYPGPHGSMRLFFDGVEFPYHTSVDVPYEVVQPEFNEKGHLVALGYVVMGVIVQEGGIADFRPLAVEPEGTASL